MVISHSLKVIFIKLKKVSGTSFEIALSKFCDSNDVITKLEEEETRISLGFTKASNYKIFRTKLILAKLKMLTGAKKYRTFKTSIEHLGAKEIKEIIAPDVWNNYLKIAIIRSPYQKAISYYFWKKRSEKLTVIKKDFEEFISFTCRRRKNKGLSIILCNFIFNIKSAFIFYRKSVHRRYPISQRHCPVFGCFFNG